MSQAIYEIDELEQPDAEALAAAADAVRRLISHLRKTKAPRAILEEVAAGADALADSLDGFDYPGPYCQRRLELPLERPSVGSETPAEFFP